MKEFLFSVLNLVNGNEGVTPIVIVVVFSSILTLILNKTSALNQKQSYLFLIFIFLGLMVFLITIYTIFLSETPKFSNGKKVQLNGSLQDIEDSNISLNVGIKAVDSMKNLKNTSIIIK